MKQFIGIMVIITLVCCLAFCEEPTQTVDPMRGIQKKATVEKVVPKEHPKKKSDDPVSMF